MEVGGLNNIICITVPEFQPPLTSLTHLTTSGRTYGWTTKPYQLPCSSPAQAGQTAPLQPDEDLGDISEGDEAPGASFDSAHQQQRDQGVDSRGAQAATGAGAAIHSRASRSEAASLMADEFKRGVGLHDVEDEDNDLGVEENAAPMRVDPQAEDSFGN